MSFRRFLYLVADDCAERSRSLRRIDTSRFFFRPSTEGEQQPSPTPLDASGQAGADLPLIKDGGLLPAPAIHFRNPRVKQTRGSVDFVLFEDKVDWRHNKVVAMNNLGRALMYHPEDDPPTVSALSSMASSKFAPFSLTVGGNLYVMDAFPDRPNGGKCRSFEVLSSDDNRFFKCEEWYWQPLEPPPFVYCNSHPSLSVESYAVVAGANIFVSTGAAASRTYSFDTLKKKWSKAGDWALPFTSLAEYVPEHKLWFGISSFDDSYPFCGANLVASNGSDRMGPPKVHGLWKEFGDPPPEWSLLQSYAVPLGSCKFCIIRFFEVATHQVCPVADEYHEKGSELQAVFTGVEVEDPGEQLRVLRHKSERYQLDATVDYRVL